MTEKKATEEYTWTDRDLLIPKGILVPTKEWPAVKGEELAVYVHMKGFGKESRASLDTIAGRLGWDVKTARVHQSALWKKGWIGLLAEGRAGSPRRWYLCSEPYGYPSRDALDKLVGKDVYPPLWHPEAFAHVIEDGGKKRDPTGKRHPTEIASLKTGPETVQAVLSSTPKDLDKPLKDTKPLKHPDEPIFWQSAKTAWSQHHKGQELQWPVMTGFQKKLTDSLARLGFAEMARRWENMVLDPWTRPSLMALVSDPDKWTTRRENKPQGGTRARSFNQPRSDDWTPSGGSADGSNE